VLDLKVLDPPWGQKNKIKGVGYSWMKLITTQGYEQVEGHVPQTLIKDQEGNVVPINTNLSPKAIR
jgi:hypothetical protein